MSVELLQTLSLIAYILAGLFFLVAAALFFYLKVPTLWGEVTGRTARKAIRAMKWKNEESPSGAIPATISQGSTRSGLSAKLAEATQAQVGDPLQNPPVPKERTPLVAPEQKPPLKAAPVTEAAEETKKSLAVQPPEETAVPPSGGEAESLPETDLGQTSALPTQETGLTEVLSVREDGDTDLLPRRDVGETAVLSTSAYNEFLTLATGELPRLDETTLLDSRQKDSQRAAPSVFFVMEKELAFTDSTEIIE